jgi:hypothetical protein
VNCTCGHGEADHYAGLAFCTTCGAERCATFTWASGPTHPEREDDWVVVQEFRRKGFELEDVHSTLLKATELRLALLHYPPRSDAEYLAVITILSKIKDASERLGELINDLVEARRVPSRRAMLELLYVGFRRYVDWLDDFGRISQTKMTFNEWSTWRRRLAEIIGHGLRLSPGHDLSAALWHVIWLLDDRTQWPHVARDYDEPTAQTLPRNPRQAFTKAMRAVLSRFNLGRELETEVLRYMGFVSGEPDD